MEREVASLLKKRRDLLKRVSDHTVDTEGKEHIEEKGTKGNWQATYNAMKGSQEWKEVISD